MTDAAVQHLSATDPVLKHLICQVGGCTLKPKLRRSPYEALVRAVVFQQLNGTAANTILGRVRALYPGCRFPRPEDLVATADERLRTAGLSRAKTAAVKDIAANRIAGLVPSRTAAVKLSDQQLLERLTAVRGVGPWTVEMLLIFTLGRPDVMPATDYGVRQGAALCYGWKQLPHPRKLLEFSERWRPHRSTAAWYFWRALELPEGTLPMDAERPAPKPARPGLLRL